MAPPKVSVIEKVVCEACHIGSLVDFSVEIIAVEKDAS